MQRAVAAAVRRDDGADLPTIRILSFQSELCVEIVWTILVCGHRFGVEACVYAAMNTARENVSEHSSEHNSEYVEICKLFLHEQTSEHIVGSNTIKYKGNTSVSGTHISSLFFHGYFFDISRLLSRLYSLHISPRCSGQHCGLMHRSIGECQFFVSDLITGAFFFTQPLC